MKKKNETIDDVTKKYLKEIGVVDFRKPAKKLERYLELPDDITNIDTVELGKYNQALNMMTVYAETKLAEMEIKKEVAEELYEREFSNKLVSPEIENVEDGVTKQKALAKIHPDVVEAKKQYFKIRTKYLKIKAIYNGYDRLCKLISREITRRIQMENIIDDR